MAIVGLLKTTRPLAWLGVIALIIVLITGNRMQALQQKQAEHHASQVVAAKRTPGTPAPQPCDTLRLQGAFLPDLPAALRACQQAPASATVVWIDFGFAVGYALFLLSLGLACAKRCDSVLGPKWSSVVRFAAWGQVAAGLADWLENVGLLLLLSNGPSGPIAWMTTIAAGLKFALLLVGVLIYLIASIWNGAARYMWHVLSATWLTAVLALAGPLLLGQVDQGQDLLRDLVERPLLQIAWFVAACLLFATSVWYGTQKSIQVSDNDYTQATAATHPAYVDEWYPRLLGGATLVLTALALQQIGVEYSKVAAGDIAIGPLQAAANMAHNLALCLLAAAAIFVLFVWWRRKIFRLSKMLPSGRAGTDQVSAYKPGDLAQFFANQKPAVVILAIFTLAGATISLAVVPCCGQSIAPVLGTATVVYIWASLIIPLASAICIASVRTGLPMLVLVLAYAVAVSFFNDNHAVRHVALPEKAQKKSDQTLDQYFDAWLDNLIKQQQPKVPASVPVLLVSAEGGGIRAAYWAALVLAHLQDKHGEQFSRHIFAMSGVSGGSLGVGAFATLLAGAHPADCLGTGSASSAQYTQLYAQYAHCALNRDFLAAPVAAMLFSDLTQRLLPYPFEALDRARFLEEGFELAFVKPGSKSNPMQEAFGALWAPGRQQVPLLLLNTTEVQSGGRGVAAYPRFRDDRLLIDVIARYDSTETLPLSAAVGLSARFPLLSPPGVLKTKTGSPWFVDGGYFDNSGAVTLREVLRVIHAANAQRKNAPRLVPVVLHIVNDANQAPRCGEGPDVVERDTLSFAQIFAPLEAVMNAREARNPVARAILAEELIQGPGDPCKANFLQFQLRAAHVSAPLGWTMSRAVEETIQDQLGSAEMAGLSKQVGDLLGKGE